MDILFIVGKWILIFITFFIVVAVILEAIAEGEIGFAWKIVKRFRVLMFFEVILLIVVTLSTYLAISFYLPKLNYGWMDLFKDGGGSIYYLPLEGAINSSSLLIHILISCALLLLFFIMPNVVMWEEETFRKGYENWGAIVWQSTKFGSAHLLLGIPIAAGMAIILPGLFLGYKYRRAFNIIKNKGEIKKLRHIRDEAVLVSTTYHSFYNMFILGLVFVGLIILFYPLTEKLTYTYIR